MDTDEIVGLHEKRFRRDFKSESFINLLKPNDIYIYIYILKPNNIYIYRVSQEECEILRDSVPYVKLPRIPI